jgi:hypothetical protein
MPFKDPESRRRYDRERRRLQRAQARTLVPVVAPAVRLRVAADVEAVLAHAIELVARDTQARGVEKARALAQIAGVALRVVDAQDLSERLEAIERVLDRRRTA